jgi:hypothetical protein
MGTDSRLTLCEALIYENEGALRVLATVIPSWDTGWVPTVRKALGLALSQRQGDGRMPVESLRFVECRLAGPSLELNSSPLRSEGGRYRGLGEHCGGGGISDLLCCDSG